MAQAVSVALVTYRFAVVVVRPPECDAPGGRFKVQPPATAGAIIDEYSRELLQKVVPELVETFNVAYLADTAPSGLVIA